MVNTIRDIMKRNPVNLEATATVVEAAQKMRDSDIGAVVVMEERGKICGLVTDRDIVIRAVAKGGSMGDVRVGDICTHDMVIVSPEDPWDKAVELMRKHAIRRLLVVEHDKPVGILSIGDLALRMDRDSALGHISAAPPNK